MSRQYHVYILTNARGWRPVLYVGVTGNLERRLAEHRTDPIGFAARYRLTTLVYLECTTDVHGAIAREKQIKGWRRAKKIDLIERSNPMWRDLATPENDAAREVLRPASPDSG